MNEDTMKEVHAMTWQLADTLVGNGVDPLIIAAMMQTVSLSLYRTLLNEDEYNIMVDRIGELRRSVKKYSDQTPQTPFH